MAAPAAAAPSSGPDLCPSFAVVCGFMERYGATLDLPEISFPQMERYLRETSTVPQPLVDLHVKLLRKLGKSVTTDRWEKYLAKVCQELNSGWAWELEQSRYLQMSMESKSNILKYLCECQFDDNLKFKALVNEEEPEKMRLQPIGRDWQGLLYWLQLDPEQNIRLYTEEQDDLDGSSWRCIVRNRNDLAEALDLLKAQIDPTHTQTKTQGGSASSPGGGDKTEPGEPAGGLKKDEEDSADHLAKKKQSFSSEPPQSTDEEPKDTALLLLKTEEGLQPGAVRTNEVGRIKQEEAGCVKQEEAGRVKQEEAEVDLKARSADLAADRKSPASFPVIDNRVSTITAIIKPETRDSDVPSNNPSNAVSVVMVPASVIAKQANEAERAVVRSSQQAKIPLKKRELKLAEGFQENRNHGNHLNNNNKGSSIIVCNPSVIQTKDGGAVTSEGKPASVPLEENAPRLELTNGKPALFPSPPPPPPHKEGGQNGVIGVIGQVGVIGHVGVIRSPMDRPRGPGGEAQEGNGPSGEEGADGPGGRRRAEEVGRWGEEEKEREGNRQSVLVRKCSVDLEKEEPSDTPAPPSPPSLSPPHPGPKEEEEEHLLSAQEEPQRPLQTEEEERGRKDSSEKETLVQKAEPADLDPEAAAEAPEAPGKERQAGQDAQARPGLLEVASSELQKEGIRLKIKIPPHKRSKKKGREEKEREAEQEQEVLEEEEEGRSLRRSARICRSSALPICRPSSKVAESQDKSGHKTTGSKDDEEEEEEQQEQDEEEGQKPALKKDRKTDPNWLGRKPKGKRRHRRPRWSTPRSKRRRPVEEGEGGERGRGPRGEEESDGGRDSEDSSQSEELPMEDACSQCGLPNHPELILLCDSCDHGYHTACLRPPLMLIPDGEWFCPPCQHKLLCERLEEQLLNLDSNLKKRERALRRKERLVYVGISVENIIPEGDVEPSAEKSQKKKDSKKNSKNLGRRSTRTRKCISYRFDDFDDAIDEAIEEDVGEVYGGAEGAVRGKDINTILSEEGKESKQPIKSQARLARNRKRRRLNDLESDSTAAESEEEFLLSNSSEEEEFAVEEEEEGEEDEEAGSDGGSEASGRRRAKAGTLRGAARRNARSNQRRKQQQRARRPRGRRARSSEEEEEETEEEMDSDWSSDMSDSEADRKRKGLRRGQRQQVNYRETSESSDNSRASANQGKENKLRLKPRKQRLSSDYSDASASSRESEEEEDVGEDEERDGRRRRGGGGRKRRRGEEEERPRKNRQALKRRRADDDEDEEDHRRRLKRRRLAAKEEEERERRRRRKQRPSREEEEEEEEKMGRGRRREMLSQRRRQRLAQMLKKRRPSTDSDDSDQSDDSQDSDSSSEEDRPVRKRLNRIDSDEDEEEEELGGGDEEDEGEERAPKTKKPSDRESRVAGGDGERGDGDGDAGATEEDGRLPPPTDELRASRGPTKPGPGSAASPRDSAPGSDRVGRHNGPLPPETGGPRGDTQKDGSDFVPDGSAS